MRHLSLSLFFYILSSLFSWFFFNLLFFSIFFRRLLLFLLFFQISFIFSRFHFILHFLYLFLSHIRIFKWGKSFIYIAPSCSRNKIVFLHVSSKFIILRLMFRHHVSRYPRWISRINYLCKKVQAYILMSLLARD